MRKYAVILLVLVCCLACATRPVTPTSKSRRIIDSVYQVQVNLLQGQMELRCKAYGDSIFHSAIDSMIRERQDEINQLVK